jgi:hypothetical protein
VEEGMKVSWLVKVGMRKQCLDLKNTPQKPLRQAATATFTITAYTGQTRTTLGQLYAAVIVK